VLYPASLYAERMKPFFFALWVVFSSGYQETLALATLPCN
jgi:hypothetical protein